MGETDKRNSIISNKVISMLTSAKIWDKKKRRQSQRNQEFQAVWARAGCHVKQRVNRGISLERLHLSQDLKVREEGAMQISKERISRQGEQ